MGPCWCGMHPGCCASGSGISTPLHQLLERDCWNPMWWACRVPQQHLAPPAAAPVVVVAVTDAP
ncbi:hypothetical protein HaLaN_03746 [Haematococcus lacustris]|uniref:Uncharacterized protein n=1 Tax=Haematococcus lacustris TaxID=44745 RepID=A0A699YF10_HAELA|nr:hypothetical protein HaLaN_03746 [Haematococcus lacustris]